VARAETQTGPAIAGLRLLGVIAALGPAPAYAGAWVAPEGGQEIWTSVAGEREGLSFFETSAYLEAPLGERTSIVAAPWVEQNYDTADGWRGEAVVGVKRALFRRDNMAVAVQGGAFWDSHPEEGCEEGGGELRLLAGTSFTTFGQDGFFNVEAASRALSGGCASERVDLTLGYAPRRNWLTMGQVFLDAPREGEETVKAQLTVVYFRRNGSGVQVGLRSRVDGGSEEAALVIGWWAGQGD
jgi:hypothetical protein